MSVPSTVVARFRTLWADRFVDSVTIRDLTSKGTYNRTTKQMDTPATVEVYSGGALLRPAGISQATRGNEGEVRHDLDLLLPYTATGIEPGHEVTVDAVHTNGDAELVGAVATVQGKPLDTYQTHRIVKLKLSQGGGDRG